MTLNIARMDPIFFSNNVLEQTRNRVHYDQNFNSYSIGLKPTLEGFSGIDSLIEMLSKESK